MDYPRLQQIFEDISVQRVNNESSNNFLSKIEILVLSIFKFRISL